MRRHTQEEVLRMSELVRVELAELINRNADPKSMSSDRAKHLAGSIVDQKKKDIETILNRPHGGALSPDEIAEIILAQFIQQLNGSITEEAAAALMA